MWIQELIKGNFSLLIDTLKKSPAIIVAAFFMITTGFFINKWVDARTQIEVLQTKHQQDLNKANEVAFDRLLIITDMQMKHLRYKNNVDSALRENIEKPLNELKNNVDRIN